MSTDAESTNTLQHAFIHFPVNGLHPQGGLLTPFIKCTLSKKQGRFVFHATDADTKN